ncbi:MAG: VOC family protein [Pelosinus sp.]|nr:VOC family protein [Pelosinus sp.]
MNFKFFHSNLSVSNLEVSVDFYKKALDLKEIRRKDFGDFIMVYLSDGKSPFELELKWAKNRISKYDLGENPSHLAFEVNNYQEALARHKGMGCVKIEHKELGVYFLQDPDGYEVEILPQGFFDNLSK